jgi:hypothetical protein
MLASTTEPEPNLKKPKDPKPVSLAWKEGCDPGGVVHHACFLGSCTVMHKGKFPTGAEPPV